MSTTKKSITIYDIQNNKIIINLICYENIFLGRCILFVKCNSASSKTIFKVQKLNFEEKFLFWSK